MTGQAGGGAPVLDERLLDALREMANIGCGHAATALSRLLGGQRVGIEVPRASVVGAGQIAGLAGRRDEPMVAVVLDITGDFGGRLLLLLPGDAARGLSAVLLGQPMSGASLAAEARSALSEVGNILGSVCLSAIARTVGLRLLPSTPRLVEAPAGALLDEAVASLVEPQERAVVLETRFYAGNEASLSGCLLIVPEVGSLRQFRQAIRL